MRKEDNMCCGPEAKSKQFTTKAHWHLSWNATSPPTYATAQVNQCCSIVCGYRDARHRRCLRTKGHTTPHVSLTFPPMIGQYSYRVDQTFLPSTLFRWIRLLDLILSLIYNATINTETKAKIYSDQSNYVAPCPSCQSHFCCIPACLQSLYKCSLKLQQCTCCNG